MNTYTDIARIREETDQLCQRLVRLSSQCEDTNEADVFSVHAERLKKVSAALEQVTEVMHAYEKEASDVFDEEILIYPETVFGTSWFSELKDFSEVKLIKAE